MPMTTKDLQTILEMYQDGTSVKAIARAVGFSEHTVYMTLREHRDVCPKRYERAPRPADERYARLKRMWANGTTMQAMADEMGLKLNAIKNVIDRHRDDFPRRRVR